MQKLDTAVPDQRYATASRADDGCKRFCFHRSLLSQNDLRDLNVCGAFRSWSHVARHVGGTLCLCDRRQGFFMRCGQFSNATRVRIEGICANVVQYVGRSMWPVMLHRKRDNRSHHPMVNVTTSHGLFDLRPFVSFWLPGISKASGIRWGCSNCKLVIDRLCFVG